MNAAFASVIAPFGEIEPDEYHRVTDVCYHGYVHGTRTALALMPPRERGVIVQVGSAPLPGHPLPGGLLRGRARTGYASAPRGERRSQAVPGDDHELDLVVRREAARAALRTLPDREKPILERSFFDEWNLERVAEEVGCSQMHVSRSPTASLERLREEPAEDDPPGSAPWNRRSDRGS